MRRTEGEEAAGVDNQVAYTPVRQPPTVASASELDLSRSVDNPLEAGEHLCCGCSPIEPNGTIRKGWDAWILGTIAWVMTVIPVRLCFFTAEAKQDAMVEIILDITWVIDLGIRFRTAYENQEGHIERSRHKIALNYATRGMLMDLIAVLPCIYEVVVATFSRDRPDGQRLSTIVWMGGSRLCKAFRVLDQNFRASVIEFVHDASEFILKTVVGYKYKHSNAYHHVNDFLHGIQHMVIIFSVLHITGCVFYAVGSHNEVQAGGREVDGWVAREHWSEEVGWSTRWTTAFYWAVTTFATVGYGDVVAHTTAERGWAPVVMLLGILTNAWVIANFLNYFDRTSQHQRRHDIQVSHIREYMRSKRMPEGLIKRILTYGDALFEQERGFDMIHYLKKMPPAISSDAMEFLYVRPLQEVECFVGLPTHILMQMAQIVMPYPMRKDDELIRPGEAGGEVFVIVCGLDRGQKGVVELRKCRHSTENERWEDDFTATPMLLEDGGIFGIEALFEPNDGIRDIMATAKTDGELLLFSARALEECAVTHPRLKRQILHYQAQRSLQISVASEQTQEPHAGVAEQPGANDGASVLRSHRTLIGLADSIDHATIETRLEQLELVQAEMFGMLQKQSQDIQTLLRLSSPQA